MNIKRYTDFFSINEDGGGDGGGGAAGSGDGGGGMAYANLGNIGGMGAVVNPTVNSIPGVPGESGSGDVSAWVPSMVYTKSGGLTGNKTMKMGLVDIPKKAAKKLTPKEITKISKMNKINKIPTDGIGKNKVMNFNSFMSTYNK